MIGKIKGAIQGRLYEKCIEDYKREIKLQTDPYLMYVAESEKELLKESKNESYNMMSTVFIENCGKLFSLSRINSEYVVFVSKDGILSNIALYVIKKYFEKNPQIDIMYADEDVWMITEDNDVSQRICPWSKPSWSPDTLLSFMYFGNVFAIRREAFLNIKWLGNTDYRKNIYDFVLKATEQGNVGNTHEIIFHKNKNGANRHDIEEAVMHETDFIGVGREYDFIKMSAFERRNIKGRMELDGKTGVTYPIYDVTPDKLVSIVIPSKDNPKVLAQCIRSVYEHTNYKNFEIIVVDNGSNPQAKSEIEALKDSYEFKYIYIPMEFNFSRMCNIGINESKGEYILLLNDDMEAIEGSWLERMVGQASLDYVGAVGAKLLYPNSSKIQHVGVTNTAWGPGHKLKQFDDNTSYYYGRNRFIYDMVGVTAACLLIRKSVLEEVGFLFEGLAVAYNDVDLCFNIYEKGLCNVQRNDVVLYHHESLSRGDDMLDEKKIERLKNEQKVLYTRHKDMYKYDPYIGTLLNSGEPEYRCGWLEDYESEHSIDVYSQLQSGKRLPNPDKMNQMMFVEIDECGKDDFSKGSKIYYVLKGWAYVHNFDNARYACTLLFVNKDGYVWELPVRKRYRKDVAKILPHEKNVELTGFYDRIQEGALPSGKYDVWVTLKDRCSRQRLYKKAKKTLIIE